MPRPSRRTSPPALLASAAALLAGGLAGGVSQADPPASLPPLSVHRTDDTLDCPDADTLAARVAKHMGRPAVDPLAARSPDPGPARPGLDVQIYRSEEGYTAVVQAGGRTRTLSDKGTRCKGLGDALAISLTILLDALPPPPPAPPPAPAPPASSPPPAPLPAPAPAPAAPPARPVPLPVMALPPPPEPIPAPSLGLLLGASVWPSLGTLAHPVSVGGSATIGLALGRHFSVETGVLGFPTQSVGYPHAVKRPAGDTTPVTAQQVDLALITGLVRGCAAAPLGSAGSRLGGCLGVVAGALLAEGRGFFINERSADPWIAAEGAALFEQPLFFRFSLVSRATLLVPLVRRTLEVRDVLDPAAPAAFTSSPVGAALDLGLRLTIW